ncbi:aspartate kinase [Alkalibacillus haloalkaliphilus]|uniref:Aspartokinase n=1 Tax=Alkalibacillus haloalkaliphilus TaxID=94136 RepID=A0A511W1Q7_9BACI|nr:aspartate kinase [Alkalibacillus haloalkaliphilus]GEN44974.1 aspartokinase 1 [Alkalibacillus haloalkaliphilus]
MKTLVQKFGGTSVRDEAIRGRAIQHIKDAIDEGYRVVVVVSAMGRKGEPYATDSLLDLIDYPETDVTKREVDLLMSCGETISSVVFTHELKQQGVTATALTGSRAGILTTSDYTDSRINKVDPTEIHKYLKSNDVVVVAGFQGQDEGGNVTTLGRGGSDTSAVALGAAMDSEYVDIFTDVDGIKTADPRLVENAKTLQVMTYNEIVHLAYQGSKVIHPRAVEIAMQEKIPIRVRSTYSNDAGTLVTAKKDQTVDQGFKDRLVTGIAHVSGITQVKVYTKEDSIRLHNDVLTKLATEQISVDFFNITTDGITFTVPTHKLKTTTSIIEALNYDYKIVEKCAKVSTVGAGIQGVPGVASRVVSALSKFNIQILQSADSHTTIWVLVKEQDLENAVNALHQEFLEDR